MAGASYVASKFGNMEEWLVTSYEGLMEQTGGGSSSPGEGLTTLTTAMENQHHQQHHHHHQHQALQSSQPIDTFSAQEQQQQQQQQREQQLNNNNNNSNKASSLCSESEIKLAIVGHPQYRELVRAHMNCHKVGAPADLAAEIDKLITKHYESEPAIKTSIGANPELDQFMVAYCNVLNAYENELRKTFKEAIEFCKKLEQQLSIISSGALASVDSDERFNEAPGYDDLLEEAESGLFGAAAEMEMEVDPLAGDKELKQMLMRKYGAFIKGLTQEYLKKKKKGKLPKESRQKLLEWWSQHQDHPYPSEVQKANLAQSTGLDPKQINNWFINQRKRHWNPSAIRGESSQQESRGSLITAEAKVT